MNYLELSRAIWNSLLICVGCIAIAVPIGSFLAVLLMRTNIYGRRALAVLQPHQFAALVPEFDAIEIPLEGIQSDNVHLVIGVEPW